MKYGTPPPLVNREAWILALAIARAIQVSQDEKDAVRRICALLSIWEVDIVPSKLGTLRQDS